MKTLKITSLVTFILYVLGFLFLIFRKTDGTGVANNFSYELISVSIWTFLFFFVFIILLIAYII
ncbi:DUF3923 family protein [Lactobacillus sp. S2-2]|uniref:DUF3923 family protein n=1 Tax=Lactobacillus sp. S2-2 TaxID=2692917 RepID=UPI001F364F4C|nr:DUF3923 family protein [Lactobacillus sp. S2-2]MCF6514911.1 DUF3923 family protein [Lactobacillus sp. S2-2]